MLPETYDCIEVNVRSLQSLDVPSAQYGAVMVSVFMSKLPSDINLNIVKLFSNYVSSFEK